jgi:hypothetical protein
MTNVAVDSVFGAWRILRITHKRALCRCQRCGWVIEISVEALKDGSTCACQPPTLITRRAFAEARAERERRRIFEGGQ